MSRNRPSTLATSLGVRVVRVASSIIRRLPGKMGCTLTGKFTTFRQPRKKLLFVIRKGPQDPTLTGPFNPFISPLARPNIILVTCVTAAGLTEALPPRWTGVATLLQPKSAFTFR